MIGMQQIMINGKVYPLWSTFVEQKDQWIGGILQDTDTNYGLKAPETKITDITLIPNGDDSAFFEVHGEDYTCGFDVKHGAIDGNPDTNELLDGWIYLNGYSGMEFKIKRNNYDG